MVKKLTEKSQTVKSQTDRAAVDFGQRVKSAREKSGLTREKLEERAGLGTGSVSRLEAGGQGARRPGEEKVRKLASVLHVDPVWLATGEEAERVELHNLDAAAAALTATRQVSAGTVERVRMAMGSLGDLDVGTWAAVLANVERMPRG